MAQTARASITLAPTNAVLWSLVGVSIAINLIAGLFTDAWPPPVLATLVTLPLVTFALAHGSVAYGWRDIAIFMMICLVVTNVVEHLGIVTGYPFGSYHYTDKLGPKLFLVPVLTGPAYFGMAYPAWMLARLLVDSTQERHPGCSTFTLPVVASFVLVSWNLSYDPLISTIRQGWIWTEGGAYFGVPVTNFVGWYLTAYVFFQLFALYLRHRRPCLAASEPQSKSYWQQPVALYGAMPGIIILGALTTITTDTVTDPAGAVWRVRDIYAVCALVSTFTMDTFSFLSLVKIAARPPASA